MLLGVILQLCAPVYSHATASAYEKHLYENRFFFKIVIIYLHLVFSTSNLGSDLNISILSRLNFFFPVGTDFKCKQRNRYYQKINLKSKLYSELFACTFLEER